MIIAEENYSRLTVVEEIIWRREIIIIIVYPTPVNRADPSLRHVSLSYCSRAPLCPNDLFDNILCTGRYQYYHVKAKIRGWRYHCLRFVSGTDGGIITRHNRREEAAWRLCRVNLIVPVG